VRVTRQVSEVNQIMAQRLERASSEVTSQLDTAGSSMLARIEETAQGMSQRFDLSTSMLERVSSELVGKLDGTGQRFSTVLDTASGAILADLGKATASFNDGLNQTTLQITGRLDEDTGLLAGRVERAGRELEQVSVNTALKLEEANRKFSKHVEMANAFLAEQLATAAGVMDERIETVANDLTGKLELTSTRVSERLDDTALLVERSVDKFDNEMARVLAKRTETLELLVADAAKRASEIDGVMSSYMNLIEDSLSASETKAREISRIIAEQSAIASRNLEGEIEKLEEASGDQIAQAARVLRDQHERAMAAMNEMLASTASDFQQTAQDMRLTAQQVVKDIDSARGELKRALLELPEETRSNADAMRRVVADQINALAVLADAVKRQTGALDLSGPGAGRGAKN
jgi:hypothetical protein